MKKIFWTTVFWLIVFLGFAFYVRMFNANMAASITTRLGTTTVTTSGEIISTSTENGVMSGINAIQTTLDDMQTKLDTLVSGTTPTVTPTPIVEPASTGTTK